MGIDGIEALTGNEEPSVYHLLKDEGSTLTACGKPYEKSQEESNVNERIILCRDCAKAKGDS
jgi:hypothetical protein